MAVNVVNGDVIRTTFTLENTGTITTNYYIYFVFDAVGEPTRTYGPLRQELTLGEVKTIPPTLLLENFVVGKTYSLTILVEYPEGKGLTSDYVLDVIYVEVPPKLALPAYLSLALQKFKLSYPAPNQLIIKVGSDVITEPIDEFGISLMDFLKKRHSIVVDNNPYYPGIYISAIGGVYQAPNPKQGFWAIFIDNNLAVWEEKDLPYITCLVDKTLPSYPCHGAKGIILKEGMNVRLEYIKT